MGFSSRGLAAASFAAALVATTSLGGCGSADCNDTATCPVGGDDVALSAENAVEGSDEVLNPNDGADDTGDAAPPSDATVDATPDVTDDTTGAMADVVGPDSPADMGADGGIDVGVEVGSDVGVDVVAPVDAPPKCRSNLLPAKGAVASSVHISKVAGLAIDGVFGTRWESVHGADPQWIYIDFGSRVFFDRVRIDWELACGANYDLQSSTDATNWTTMTSVSGNTLGTYAAPTGWATSVDHTGFSGFGRYLRIFGTVRCTVNPAYGYSIWEMQVYGDTNTACTP